jgi:hypothetical protein
MTNVPGYGTAPHDLCPAGITRKQVNIMLKSVVSEKSSDAAFTRISECLCARIDPRVAISFCNIGNMSKCEAEFPSVDLTKRVKTVGTSLGLPTSKRFTAAMAFVSCLSFEKPMISIELIVLSSAIPLRLNQRSSHGLGISLQGGLV